MIAQLKGYAICWGETMQKITKKGSSLSHSNDLTVTGDAQYCYVNTMTN